MVVFSALGFIRDSCYVAVGDDWLVRKGEIRLLDFVSNACVSIFLLRAPRRAGYGKAVAQEKGRRRILRPFSLQTRVSRVGAAGIIFEKQKIKKAPKKFLGRFSSRFVPRRAGYGKAVAQEKGRRKILRPFSFQTRVPRVGAAGYPKQKNRDTSI